MKTLEMIRKACEAIGSLTSWDLLGERVERENQLEIASRGTKKIFPAECDLKTIAKIYCWRLRTTYIEYPLAFIARITGIDYLCHKLEDKRNRDNKD